MPRRQKNSKGAQRATQSQIRQSIDSDSAGSFGTFFRALRESAEFSIDQLSELTKVSKQYLEYLESEEFGKLPPPVYIRGFIVRCGKFLGEDNTPSLLRLYAARANQDLESLITAIRPQKARTAVFLLAPQYIAFVFGAFFFLSVSSFLVARFTPFLFQPDVEISSLSAENTVVNFSILKVEGRARFSSVLTLNGEMLYIGEKGIFLKEVELNEGVNSISIEAKSIFGRKIEVVRRVVYIKN